MTTTKLEQLSPREPTLHNRKSGVASAAHRLSGAVRIAGGSATTLIMRVPGTVHATQAGANGTTNALRRLPDSTLRWLAASSLGLGAGFYLTGAPRPVVAAGLTPALFMGAAIIGRPIERVAPPKVR
jgi:hypothetical protein